MFVGTLHATLLGNLFTGRGVRTKMPEKEKFELQKARLELARIFNATSSFE